MTKHIHKLTRVRLGNDYIVYKCTECPRVVRQELVIGEKTICWRCQREMMMTVKSAKLKKPHHPECTLKDGRSRRKAVEAAAVEKLVERMMQ